MRNSYSRTRHRKNTMLLTNKGLIKEEVFDQRNDRGERKIHLDSSRLAGISAISKVNDMSANPQEILPRRFMSSNLSFIKDEQSNLYRSTELKLFGGINRLPLKTTINSTSEIKMAKDQANPLQQSSSPLVGRMVQPEEVKVHFKQERNQELNQSMSAEHLEASPAGIRYAGGGHRSQSVQAIEHRSVSTSRKKTKTISELLVEKHPRQNSVPNNFFRRQATEPAVMRVNSEPYGHHHDENQRFESPIKGLTTYEDRYSPIKASDNMFPPKVGLKIMNNYQKGALKADHLESSINMDLSQTSPAPYRPAMSQKSNRVEFAEQPGNPLSSRRSRSSSHQRQKKRLSLEISEDENHPLPTYSSKGRSSIRKKRVRFPRGNVLYFFKGPFPRHDFTDDEITARREEQSKYVKTAAVLFMLQAISLVLALQAYIWTEADDSEQPASPSERAKEEEEQWKLMLITEYPCAAFILLAAQIVPVKMASLKRTQVKFGVLVVFILTHALAISSAVKYIQVVYPPADSEVSTVMKVFMGIASVVIAQLGLLLSICTMPDLRSLSAFKLFIWTLGSQFLTASAAMYWLPYEDYEEILVIMGSITLGEWVIVFFLVLSKRIWPECDDYAVLAIVVYLAPISIPTYIAFCEICCIGKSTLGTAPRRDEEDDEKSVAKLTPPPARYLENQAYPASPRSQSSGRRSRRGSSKPRLKKDSKRESSRMLTPPNLNPNRLTPMQQQYYHEEAPGQGYLGKPRIPRTMTQAGHSNEVADLEQPFDDRFRRAQTYREHLDPVFRKNTSILKNSAQPRQSHQEQQISRLPYGSTP